MANGHIADTASSKTMFCVRNYQQGVQVLLAACDPELLDTQHEEGELRLQVPSSFYDGLRVEEEELRRLLQNCTLANLVGERTIGIAVDLGVVDESHVRQVDGIPHAQMMVL